jgi:soluble lytic murein transglycosylase
MSSTMSRTGFLISAGLIALAISASQASAQTAAPGSMPALPASAPPATPPQVVPPRPMPVAAYGSAISASISQWDMLRRNDGLSFSSYASFLIANQGWPGEAAMRRNAERAIRADGESAAQVTAFFTRFPPQTAAGWLRFAEALQAQGRTDAARDAAVKAWTTGTLVPDDESRLLMRFGGMLRPDDHDARMDRLLWNRATAAAQRQLPMTSAARRPLFDVRLALLSKTEDAPAKALAAGDSALTDIGFANDYAWWLRSTGQHGLSRQLLAGSRKYTTTPVSPQSWLETRLSAARSALSAGDNGQVLAIARLADDAYAPGTLVRERPFAERDVYTDLVWLGATTALNRMGRAADAQLLFERYAAAAQSAQTRARGLYWAARAAQAAGKGFEANVLFERAGALFDQFYGQLALERLGRKPVLPPAPARTIEISAAERAAFTQRSVVQALVYLGQTGNWTDQSLFVRALASGLKTDLDHVLAAELADRVNRTDLKLLVGRNARNLDLPDYFASSFPQIAVPPQHATNWTIIHAITRQESQFDRQATSPVGARGLMQLMPGTARETAPLAGLTYEYGSLVDPLYNIALGSTYFGTLMDRYGGNYVLSVAAYNAGPGRVNQWLRANGDPRNGTDVLTWIEAIPISETRNYVQRVLENAVVYDLMNPRRSASRAPTPLSALLGRQTTTYGGL